MSKSVLARIALFTVLSGGAIGCGLSEATATNPTIISVRVRDDRGAPIDKVQVDVTQTSKYRSTLQTTIDGTAEFEVTNVGVYSVSIAPRDGYQTGADLPTKNVWVVGNVRVTLDFVLQRVSTNP